MEEDSLNRRNGDAEECDNKKSDAAGSVLHLDLCK